MKKFIRKHSRELSVALAIVIMFIIFGSVQPIYLSSENIKDIVDQSTIYGLMAIGMTGIIISGGIDLSVGSVLAFICVAVSMLAVSGVSPGLCIIAGLTIGFFAGLLNGFLVSKLKLQPFIATLGTMSAFRGAAYLLSGGYPVLSVPDTYRSVLNLEFFGTLKLSVILLFAFALLMYVVMGKLKLGTYVYAIGGNEEAARLSGIRVDYNKLMIYGLGMLGTATAAMIQVAKLGTGDPTTGQGYELNAIAAVAIGGTSMAGGRGSIVGTVLGTILFAGLRNGLIVSGVETFWQYVATGVVIIIAAYIEVIQGKLSNSKDQ